MKKLRDFKCDYCGHIAEFMVNDHVEQVICQKCNVTEHSVCIGDTPTQESMTLHLATRLVSAPKCFQNTTGKSPSASNKK
jgi:hypothetical protein